MYLQDTGGDENYKLYRVRIASRETTCLTDFDGVSTHVPDRLRSGPDEILISMNKRDPEVVDPYRLSVETGEMELMAENPGNVREWMADSAGIVRIGFSDGIICKDFCLYK